MSSHEVKRRPQTTVLVGGSNGTKTLLGLLGDKSNPRNEGHVLRVVTRSPQQFLEESSGNPKAWKCNEQQIRMPEVPLTIFPESVWTKWKTHLGAADSVLPYSDSDGEGEDAFDKALSGIGAMDDGGVADCVILCCPVYAHLPILKRIARALYRLDRNGRNVNGPPLLIGSLYAAGGLDWQARMAFAVERPASFSGKWKREVILFGLKAFPFLTKSIVPGQVTLFGRFPELLVALSPPSPRARARARLCLDRILQKEETGRGIEFLGMGADKAYGGDGSVRQVDEEARTVAAAAAAAGDDGGLPCTLVAKPISDHADPTGSIGFLTCTMNATNQWLHPCILAALFGDSSDGRISWPLKEKKTALPRFYSDGASKPEAGRLITAIACAEVYPLLDCLDAFFSPSGMRTISSLHGGEPVGRMIVNTFGNSPRNIGERSGLTELVLQRAQGRKDVPIPSISSRDRVRMFQFFSFSMGFGLSHNHRIGHVLSPAERIKDAQGNPTDYIRPIPTTRFFVDDLNHGLCICLGLGELFGFDLERDMPDTLAVVRKLQGWMGKEFVLPKGKFGKKLVAEARDLHETSSPQAFGVTTVQELRSFLSLSPIGEDTRILAEARAAESPIGQQLRSKL